MAHPWVVADVWEKDVWEFQAKSGSLGSCRLFLHFLGTIAVQEMSGTTPGSPRHPSSRHPRPSDHGDPARHNDPRTNYAVKLTFFRARKKGFSFFPCGSTPSRTVPKTQPLEVAFSLLERVDLRSQKGRIFGKKMAWGRVGWTEQKKRKKGCAKLCGKICYCSWPPNLTDSLERTLRGRETLPAEKSTLFYPPHPPPVGFSIKNRHLPHPCRPVSPPSSPPSRKNKKDPRCPPSMSTPTNTDAAPTFSPHWRGRLWY